MKIGRRPVHIGEHVVRWPQAESTAVQLLSRRVSNRKALIVVQQYLLESIQFGLRMDSWPLFDRHRRYARVFVARMAK